jgi:STE24 endopeptidase
MTQPPEDKRRDTLAKLERAAASLRRQEMALALVSFSVGLGYLLAMLSSGSVRLREFVTREGVDQSQWAVVAWYLLFFTLIYHVLHLPVSFVRGYVVERRFQLSRQRLRRWLWAHAKKIMVSTALVVFLGEFMYLFLRLFERRWWIAAWTGYILFGLLLSRFGSRVLLPIFYKREDLPMGELRSRVAAIVRRAGFRVSGVKRVILAKDTRKANAAVVGIGSSKEILISDTLAQSLSPEEVEAVVAHEIAHLRMRHTEILFAVGVGLSFLGFALAGGVLHVHAGAFGLRGPSDVAGFPLVILVFSALYLLVTPPLNWFSRQLERASDIWAARYIGSPAPLISGLEKLSRTNLAERRQPGWYEAIFASHPSTGRRIDYLKHAFPDHADAPPHESPLPPGEGQG